MNFSNTHFSKNNEGSIPIYPFYGYDNTEELDKDIDYMKNLYSKALKIIQQEVDEECDKLEYEGSCMFDTFPDQVHLGTIIDTIYDRLSNNINLNFGINDYSTSVQMEQLNTPSFRQPPPPMPAPCRGTFCPPPPMPSRPPRPPRPDNRPDGNPDWLRDLISSLLYNEMIHRRRRYRSRKKWNNK